MSSSDDSPTIEYYDASQRTELLALSASSIISGLNGEGTIEIDPGRFAPPLRKPRASFVTLEIANTLRGCIGSLEATRPLVRDVVQNAFAAAFEDPRFTPLRHDELAHLHIKLSILSPLEPLAAEGADDLLRQLRPDYDGLVVQDGRHRATFLPSVWEQLPQPHVFLNHLWLKAGLDRDHWSPGIALWRYTSESFGGPLMLHKPAV